MIRLLTSVKFTFWIIVAICAWLATGAAMASGGFKQEFLVMNDMLVLKWLIYEASNEPLVFGWFVILCLLAVLLGINFLLCTSGTLYRLMKFKNFNFRTVVLFSLHLACMGIVALHAAGLAAGFKQGYITAFRNDIIDLPSGYSVMIRDVVFVDDTKILKNKKGDYSRIRYTRENFSIEKNYAEVVLLRFGKILQQGKAFYMKPFVSHGIWITLESFHLHGKGEEAGIAAKLTVAKNPVLIPFFVFYSLVVILLFLYAAISWGKPFLQEQEVTTTYGNLSDDLHS